MFWLLIGMSAAVFAPCVLLPVWREYQALSYAEQVERAKLAQAHARLEEERRRLDGVQADPTVIERLARRELRYRGPEETAVPVNVRPEPKAAEPVAVRPVSPPRPLAWVARQLPESDCDRLFCAGPTRTLLMCGAGALVVTAFLLYTPRRRPADGEARALSGLAGRR
jgi:hypothetical protein